MNPTGPSCTSNPKGSNLQTENIYYSCLYYLTDICKEGGSVILELKVLGSDTVIAKDADSKMQLTDPL